MFSSVDLTSLYDSIRAKLDAIEPDVAENILKDLRDFQRVMHESQQQVSDIINFLPDPTFIISKEGKVLAWNHAIEEMTGVKAGDILDKGDYAYAIPFYKERRPILIDIVMLPQAELETTYAHLRRSGNALIGQGHIIGISGKDLWFEGSAAVLRDSEGNIAGAIETIRDVTSIKMAEDALKESEQRMADIINFLPEATLVIDKEGKVVAWNRAMEELSGVKAEDIIGKGNYEYALPFYGERRPVLIDLALLPMEDIEQKYRSLQREGRAIVAEALMSNVRGREIWSLDKASPLLDIEGNIAGAIEIVRDITEKKRAEEELKEAKRLAEEANRARGAFLASMSHEIRTPMNGIIGMTSLLLDSTLTHQQRDFVETIRFSSDALLTIINDILDFSKIEAGKIELEQAPFDLRRCAENALDLLAPRAAEKHLEIGCLIEAHTPTTIVGDFTRLGQILTNLLSNAVKFTEHGEVMISIDARLLPGGESGAPQDTARRFELQFAVRDTGIGIPSERIDSIFESFTQVDASTTRKYGGTGLGLTITKRLIEMMGGRIWVESELGKGSTFNFTIVAQTAPDTQLVYAADAQPELMDKRVLIVDDNATNRKILELQTQAWGMKPVLAASGYEAMEFIRKGEPFALALLDLQMPEMNGLMLAEAIRSHRDRHALPMVLLSSLGYTESDQRMTFFETHLTKPIKPSQLYNSIMQVLAKISAQTQLGFAATASKTSEFDSGFAHGHPLSILLAEDNHINQKVALITLERLGYNADVAGNGREVLDALKRQAYDVVLMDVEMPEMDGLEASAHIRSQFATESQPYIIAMTANAMIGDRERCLKAGMNDYVSKPIKVGELVAALTKTRVKAGVKPQAEPQVETQTFPAQAPEPAQPQKSQPQAGEIAKPLDILDRKALEQLQVTLGNKAGEMLPILIASFYNEVPKFLLDARKAYAESKNDDLRRAAHTLKSNAANFGAHRLAAVARELEALVRENRLDTVEELITQAGIEFEHFKPALEAARKEF